MFLGGHQRLALRLRLGAAADLGDLEMNAQPASGHRSRRKGRSVMHVFSRLH